MKPLFMWAGGKTKMMPFYRPFLPKTIGLYIEPFLGGGAMAIEIHKFFPNTEMILSDLNSSLISIYSAIRNDLVVFIEAISGLEVQYLQKTKQERYDFYYEQRNIYAWEYEKYSETEQAALLYFLMKTGFNGIWQVNKNTNNRYGTPVGLCKQTFLFDYVNIQDWHDLLQKCILSSASYRETCQSVSATSFVFCDPPYRNSFADYNSSFSDDNQKELLDLAATSPGTWWICNRHTADLFFPKYIASKQLPFQIKEFPVTYTVGRKKKVEDGFVAVPATELLMIKENI